MKIKFGVGIPTGTEGLMYPIPFAKCRDNIDISVLAEKLGYDSVWANDHISTQSYVRDKFDVAPNYYSPLITLTSIAENTETLKIATGLLVLSFRHPVVVAKEIATLDKISGGRLIIGVGIGAYREEFESMLGSEAGKVHRGNMLDESLLILNKLFEEDISSYQGEYFDIKDVQSYPRPEQNPFPFYIGGNSPKGRERTARYGQGWLPAVLSPAEIADGVKDIKKYCNKYNRNFSEIDIAPQLAVSIGKNQEEALKKFKKSQLYHHFQSLKKSTFKDQIMGTFEDRSLIGSPEKIANMIEKYIEAGVTNFSALLFAVNSIQEMKEAMRYFAEEVIDKI